MGREENRRRMRKDCRDGMTGEEKTRQEKTRKEKVGREVER